MLLKPDVVLRNITESVMAALHGHGLEVLAFRVGAMNSDLYSAMYFDQFRYDLDYWELNREAYEYGPIVGILVRDSQGAPPHECLHRLLKIKGSAVPRLAAQGTLRHDLSASSRVFNVLHVPDSVAASIHQSRIWFKGGGPTGYIIPMKEVLREIDLHRYGAVCGLQGAEVLFSLQYRALHGVESLHPHPLSQSYKHGRYLLAREGCLTQSLVGTYRQIACGPSCPVATWAQICSELWDVTVNAVSLVQYILAFLDTHAVFLTALERFLVKAAILYQEYTV